MSDEKHHHDLGHGLFHHHKDKDNKDHRPEVETDDYESKTNYEGGYSETKGYTAEGEGGRYTSETTEAHGSAAPGGGQYTGETTGYVKEGHGGKYSETKTEAYGTTESGIDYKEEVKHHKHLEELGGIGVAAAGAYALHEKHKAKKDPEHAHRHKIEEEIAAVSAVGAGGYAFHEHHEKKEAREEESDDHGKNSKHHHRS